VVKFATKKTNFFSILQMPDGSKKKMRIDIDEQRIISILKSGVGKIKKN
jgi:hypothetical protein